MQFYTFSIQSGLDGNLLSVEGENSIPFAIARVYYLFGMPPEARRGLHAHRSLQQAAVCMSGSCRFLLDDGADKTTVCLDSPARGLYVGKMVWHELYDFSPDCVLAVYCDMRFDESDYIRNYQDFLKLARAKI